MNMSGYVILEDRGLVTVGGDDRADFLQGLISNDIGKVSEAHAIWAALLTPQGKYLHDFFVAEIDGTFYLDCEAARLMDLGQRLSRYKLRAKIDLGVGEGFVVAAAFGDGALECLGLAGAAGAAKPLAGGVVFIDPRLAAVGARAILPRATAAETLTACGLQAATADAYDRWRLALGLPDGSRDLVIEKSLLLESNFEELNGVDWDKGCYLGQELTARTKYRGLVKKRLMPVEIDGDAPEPGTQIVLDGKDAGEMRSARGGQGLALLRIEQMEKAIAGTGELRAGDARITPRKLDWASS
jgi:folate-binding protein YgfZ